MEAMCHTPRERRGVWWREKGQKERKGKKAKKRKKMKEREKGKSFFLVFSLVYGERVEEGKRSEKLYLLFKIYRDRAIVFHRSKRQSSSTRRELRVGRRIWGFLQTPRDRGFSPTLVILGLRAI